MRQNRLNDLTPREWIRFQKSWFIHNPPKRKSGVVRHPAKFPESMAQEFIEFFTKRGGRVLDPMVGTGSTLIAAARSGRHGVGIDLNEEFLEIARAELATLETEEGIAAPEIELVHADARDILELDLPLFDYCLTSPPYWDMLTRKGYENQANRRAHNLPLKYSDADTDLGNIADYDAFLNELVGIYEQVHALLVPGAYMTVIVKNVKKGSRMYPLAWDIARRLESHFTLKDERIWCQDDQRLAPYGMFSAWVSNTHHHYCLIFRKN